MDHAASRETMENVRKHKDNKLVATERRRNSLVSERKYHSRKLLKQHLLAIEIKKIEKFMNKAVYLGRSILELSKTLMHEFWGDYVKPKYGKNAKLCYMDRFSLYT